MLLFRILYYCYFMFFNTIMLGQINREFAVKLMSLAFMSMFSTSLLVIFFHYAVTFNFNSDIRSGICIILIIVFYIFFVHQENQMKTISIVKKMRPVWKVVSYIVVYSLTILAFGAYYKLIN